LVAVTPVLITSALVMVRLAREATVLFDAKVTVPVPKAALLLIAKVPAFRIVPPEKLLVPVRVVVPMPLMARPPVPLMIPPKLEEELLTLAMVSVADPRVTEPTPFSPPTVLLKFVMESVPVLEMVRTELELSALVEEACKIPTAIVVGPAKLLLPLRFTVVAES